MRCIGAIRQYLDYHRPPGRGPTDFLNEKAGPAGTGYCHFGSGGLLWALLAKTAKAAAVASERETPAAGPGSRSRSSNPLSSGPMAIEPFPRSQVPAGSGPPLPGHFGHAGDSQTIPQSTSASPRRPRRPISPRWMYLAQPTPRHLLPVATSGMRRSFGARWSSWREPGVARPSSRVSLVRRPGRSHCGSSKRRVMLAKATAERQELVRLRRENRRRFKTQTEAKMAVFEWLEGWYNPHRRHSALGRISPINFERRQLTQKAA